MIAWCAITSLEIWTMMMAIIPIIITLIIVVPNIAIIVDRSSVSQNCIIVWFIKAINSHGTRTKANEDRYGHYD